MSFTISGRTNVGEVRRKREETVSLLHYANEHRQLGSFNDVEICAGNENIPANKMVLSCFSSFFEKMFKTEMKEKYDITCEIQCIDGDSMKCLIDFIYTGNIDINANNVCNLLKASDYLLMEDLKKFCFEFLLMALSHDNCFLIHAIAGQYQNKTMLNDVEQFICENFDEAIYSDEFKSFSKNSLISLISKQVKNKVEELSVYKAITEWAKHDKERHSSDFQDLFSEIKLSNIPKKFLLEVVSKDDLVRNNISCLQSLIDALCMEIGGSCSVSRIVSLGGEKSGEKVFEVFNCLNEPSKQFPALPETGTRCCAIKLNDFVYYIGGYSETAWRMDLKEKELKWKQIASMKKNKSYIDCAVSDNTIVVTGGIANSFVASSVLSSCEFYSPHFNSWSSFTDMNQARSGHALVACEEKLYAIGGHGGEYLSSVECFTPGNKTWLNVKSMDGPRNRVTAVSLNGYIYAIGGMSGKDASTTLKSCERYDVAKDEWSFINDIKFPRSECSACVLDGKIYVVGGTDAEGKVMMEIECYEPQTDEWNVVGKTDEPLYGHSLVVV